MTCKDTGDSLTLDVDSEGVKTPLISAEEKELALKCINEFEAEDYSNCLKDLFELEQLRSDDYKVFHNRAIVEFYERNCCQVDNLLKALNSVASQILVSLINPETLVDSSHSVLFFNYAVILYHQKQYKRALSILNRLQIMNESLDENLAENVWFLLLEVYIKLTQPENSFQLINFIEGSSSSSFDKCNASSKSSPDRENKEKDSKVSKDALSESSRVILSEYKIKNLLLLRNVKTCKKEIKGLIPSGNPNLSCQFLKAQLEYLRNNFKKAIKLLNSLPSPFPEFSVKGESVGVFYYNNMGCIHHGMNKPNLACFYFQKAINENQTAISSLKSGEGNDDQPLQTIGSNLRYELLYNLGLSFLYAGKLQQAFDCLTEAVQVYHTNPRLWLRLAECCIQVNKPNNEDDFKFNERKQRLIQKVIGCGVHRKLILPCTNKTPELVLEGQSGAIPVTQMEFASFCLRNALVLLPDESKLAKDTESSGKQEFYSLPPSSPIKVSDIGGLRCAVLCASAYTALCLGDFLLALKNSQLLLAEKCLSGPHKLLGNLYAAESLVMLNRLSESSTFLSTDILKDMSLSLNLSPNDKLDRESTEQVSLRSGKEWYPGQIPLARLVLTYNTAVLHTLNKDFDRAAECLKQCMTKSNVNDVPIQVVTLSIYINIQQGQIDAARSIIKQHCPHYR